MQNVVETDIAIMGGGVAGLWLLNRLRQLGFAVILLESASLGGGQTHKAQGIIHGGVKYALEGEGTEAAEAIAEMPAVWQKCLEGKGDIDLTHVPILSPYQYLFSTHKLAGKITGFFAGLALQGKLQPLVPEAYPQIFRHQAFKGVVYALNEMAIDMQALVRELAKPNQDVIFKINPLEDDQLHFDENGRVISLTVQSGVSQPIQIKAQKYIFTAGAGNEQLLKKRRDQEIVMQRRPLHMVVVKTDFSYPVYAHCLGLGATPRITITTHQAQDGKTVWYLGGQISEEGVKYSPAIQTNIAKKELQDLFPWLDFSTAHFASFFVDRAEPLQPGGKRPDGVYVKALENAIVAWPTKLALAPKLAEQTIECLQKATVKQGVFDTRALRAFPIPALAKPIWDELLC